MFCAAPIAFNTRGPGPAAELYQTGIAVAEPLDKRHGSANRELAALIASA